MFIFTLSKKKSAKYAAVGIAAIAAAAIGVSALLSSLGSGASEKQHPIYKVDRNDNKVALTFDVAFGNSNTDALLKILSEAQVPATFFVTGDFAAKHPDDVAKMAAAGHEIGNNSDAHMHLIDNGANGGSKSINVNALIEDTRSAATKIAKITGEEPVLYRSPYGEYDDNILTTIRGMGLTPIQYSVDSLDWQEPPADVIEKRVLDGAVTGTIILLHNDIANTETALPNILTKLKKRGTEFVTVSNLIYHGEYTVDKTGKQIPASKDAFDPKNDAALEVAVSAMKQVITTEQAADALKNGITPETAAKLSAVLTAEQIKLLQSSDRTLIMAMFSGQYASPVMASISDIAENSNPVYGKGGAVGEAAPKGGEPAVQANASMEGVQAGGEPLEFGKDVNPSEFSFTTAVTTASGGGNSGGGGVARYITTETDEAETAVPSDTTVTTGAVGAGAGAGGYAEPAIEQTLATVAATASTAATAAATATEAEVEVKAGAAPGAGVVSKAGAAPGAGAVSKAGVVSGGVPKD